jgi:hypothetical protein
MAGLEECMDMDGRMFFVIGSPRSGTTMLMRMLNVHEDIYTRPEPHLLTPLAHLGYYAYVDKAPYDQFQAAQSVKGFVADLPGGEQDHVDALRAYSDTMYGRMLEPTGKKYFLDKTPAYALILPFLAKVFPRAKYVVLTRHPFAIFSSFAKSFFDNDWEAAHHFNPILERYVPALARFIRREDVPFYHVRYENLVADPEGQMRALCETIDLPYQESMINYGDKKVDGKGLGDPIGVGADKRPNTKSVDKWALEVKGNPKRIALLEKMVKHLEDEDLATWGYTRDNLWDPLADVDEGKATALQSASKKWDRYHMERRLLLHLRKGIHGSTFGNTLDRVRFYCDVLLRE